MGESASPTNESPDRLSSRARAGKSHVQQHKAGDAATFLPPVRRQGADIGAPTARKRFDTRRLNPRLGRGRRLPKPRIPGQPTTPRWPTWLSWVLVGLVFVGVAAKLVSGNSQSDTIDYGTFLEKASLGEVRRVVITNGTGHISGQLADGTTFSTSGPQPMPAEDRNLLKATTLRFRTAANSRWESPLFLIFPAFGLLLLLALAARRSASTGTMSRVGDALSVGRSKAKLWTAEKPNTTFADAAGYEEVKTELREVVAALTDPNRFAAIGARAPKGVLLVGPPGTGKTLFARAVAGEASVPFLSVTGSDFMEMFVGVGASRVRDLFATARLNAPCIIFIDEIDGVGRKRGAGVGGGHDEREQTLNQLLAEMDGFDSTQNVVVLAATNRPDVLDAALLRPGRFDRQVVVPLPDLHERLPILQTHASSRNVDPNVDLSSIARATPGMSGADLSNLVNEAALCAVRRNSGSIETTDFELARDRIVLGQRREGLVLSERDREVTAYHEAGHALVAELLSHADPIHKVTLLPHGSALGVTMQIPSEDRTTYTEAALLDRLCVAMGGRAAERLVFDHLTTGASNDLVTSTELARRMVREWGMSATMGPMAWGSSGEVFLGEGLVQSRECADDTSRRIDAEVETILRDQEARALTVLTKNRVLLDTIARALIREETLDGASLRAIISNSKHT
jgi:cell division protease FtsH